MTDKTTEALRGDAARRAELTVIAKRNDAARAAGVRRRAAKDATLAHEAAQLDKREMRSLRDQPRR